ncbi:hypothetical protein Atai01_49210 [Amycolatopsis taiwanensis]|uniref:Uncharacterized protein n=1 Tax=Amycolatopsis taiwanensis TaxID=342230 RepID=A0A9W6VIC1_9PSEU|nr:hypothetical protein Atai01_49210 [Amycolatopsis taiwanensis]
MLRNGVDVFAGCNTTCPRLTAGRTGSVVDELLAERRAEAAREDSGYHATAAEVDDDGPGRT